MDTPDLSRRELLIQGSATVFGLALFHVPWLARAFPSRPSEEIIPWLDQPPTNPSASALANVQPREEPKSGQPKRIGILGGGSPNEMLEFERPFLVAMSNKGWIVGDNLAVERAYADGKTERLAGLAGDLVRKRLDVIVSGGAQTTIAAARATRLVPIVFSGALWPVEQGLIDSFARPGRNVTGHAFYAGIEFSTKRLQFLREIVPAAKRLSWVWPEFLFSAETMSGGRVDMIPAFEAAAKGQGFETRFHLIRRGQDIDAVFGEVTAWRAQAMTVAVDAADRLAELALSHRLPSAFALRENVKAGGLLSYGPLETNISSLTVRAAEYVDHILRGAHPADLPVEIPSRYELVINMKTAKALSLNIPQSVLQRADEVIQ